MNSNSRILKDLVTSLLRWTVRPRWTIWPQWTSGPHFTRAHWKRPLKAYPYNEMRINCLATGRRPVSILITKSNPHHPQLAHDRDPICLGFSRIIRMYRMVQIVRRVPKLFKWTFEFFSDPRLGFIFKVRTSKEQILYNQTTILHLLLPASADRKRFLWTRNSNRFADRR